ncbi:MAG: acetyltransferase [Hyphomicrobiaceae bacterium]|nr:acetyltransferase [Hyphomicrobiaceae bacterium]
MTRDLFGIYGAAGHGRDIMPVARENLRAQGMGLSDEQLVFIDDAPRDRAIINGQRVMTYATFLAEPATRRFATISVADGAIRARLALKLASDGIQPFDVRAQNAIIMDDVTIGAGALLSPFVTLTSNIKIGRYFHANLYSYVAHDCVIGDFVTFGPGAKCNGNVMIEDYVYVGAGAVIKQGRPGAPTVIGRGAVVGMGAVVTKSVAPGVTVVGNPAQPHTVAPTGAGSR